MKTRIKTRANLINKLIKIVGNQWSWSRNRFYWKKCCDKPIWCAYHMQSNDGISVIVCAFVENDNGIKCCLYSQIALRCRMHIISYLNGNWPKAISIRNREYCVFSLAWDAIPCGNYEWHSQLQFAFCCCAAFSLRFPPRYLL